MKRKQSRSLPTSAFTLLELLVGIAIIISVLFIGWLKLKHQPQQQNKIALAQADLDQLGQAINSLYQDTGLDPAHLSRSPCVQDPELYLDSCEAGLQCTDERFPNWQGPYLKKVPQDPWGNRYYFDADYTCRSGVTGCEQVPDKTVVRAILSGGPNGSTGYDTDNIVHIICE